MEMSQENYLQSYIKQIKMSFLKNRKQEGKTSPDCELAQVGTGRIQRVGG
jgi:hypothetical protein